MQQHKHRLEWLDSLRGIAAVLVTIIHLFGTLRFNYPDIHFFKKGEPLGLLIFDFFDFGKIGVVIFFFVSGFVIPYSILNKGLKHFAISRFFRLYPAYWVSILLAILINGIVSLKVVLVNATMLQKFVGVEDLVGVYWTLQIEIIFYIFCALLFAKNILYKDKWLKRIVYVMLSVAVLMAIARYLTEKKLPVAVPLSLCVMFTGLFYRKYLLKQGGATLKQVIIMFATLLSLLFPICILAYNKDYGFDEHWYKYYTSYSIAIIFFIVYSKYQWVNKLLVFLGAISYSLYLIHVLVFNAMDAVQLHKSVSPLTYTLLFYVAAIGLSILCYNFVEKPMVNYGRSILKNNKQPTEII